MKPKIYSLCQRCIAHILLASFFLQSCTNFSNPAIPIEEKQDKTYQRISSLEKNRQSHVHLDENKKLVAQGGHIATIHEEDGQLQADIKVNTPPGFSKSYSGLPLYVETGIDLTKIMQLDKISQERFVEVKLPKNGQTGYVYVGKRGLLGGTGRGDGRKRVIKKQKVDLKGEDIQHHYDEEEKDHHYFTKCEYYTRYAGTSHFVMNDCDYWGTYFRSTGRGGESGRFAKKDIDSKTFKNKNLNIEKGDSYHSRTGTFRNPYEKEEYRNRVENPKGFKEIVSKQDLYLVENTQGLNLENPLYEELLDYRNQICLQVFNRALELLPNSKESLELIHHNEYPCLIVKIPFIQHFEYTESWNKLFIAYYVAIINKEAERAGIPIEMVIRSGFGHLLPSIDVTAESFRINVGVVPTCYGELIAKSLVVLQDIITNKLNISLEKYAQIDSDKINKQIEKYNQAKIKKYNTKLEKYNKLEAKKQNKKSHPKKPIPLSLWNKKQKCYEILQYVGDAKGQSIVCQITRKRIYLDLLADYVANELDNKESDLTFPLVRMLGHLDFGDSISTNISQSSFKRNSRKWLPQENSLLQKDEQFWKTITQTVRNIGGGSKICDTRTLHGLYSKLEKSNKEFIIRSASTIAAKDGLGSDSEQEAEGPKKQKLYAKKLTVTTGMMAINVAHYLARYYLKQYLGIKQYRAECKSMYFETEDSLKLSAKGQEKLAVLNNKKTGNPSILFFDLNHCDVSGAQSARLKHYIDGDLAGENIPVIVMDYSSSTPSHIKCAINDAIAAGVKLILLVSSGLKNEQLSADNPYGTVRIITLHQEQREKLYQEAKKVLKENGGIPATAHKIRKGYKKARLIPTNQQILSADTSRKDFKEQEPIIVTQLYKNPYEIERYKKTLLKQIDDLFKRPILITQQQRELMGEARARKLEQQTVVGHIENILREMIVDELKPFVKENRERAIQEAYSQAESQYEKERREYDQATEDYEEGNGEWDYDGQVMPESPSFRSIQEIREEYEDLYGDLKDLSNLIDRSGIEDDTLSQILYDNFITIDGMDAILEALEYNTLNLNPKLVRRILNNCDVQFYDVHPTQNGFLVKYLKESIEERFRRIAVAYPEGRDEQGRTPLHIAAEKGQHEEVCRLLLDKGTEVNAQDKYRDTPLHVASEKGYSKIIELLVSKGASITARNTLDNTPLDEAILYGNLEACNLLLELGANVYDSKDLNHALQTATRQGLVEVVKFIINLIIKKGINIDAQDDKGNTLLHIAALNAHVDVLKLLLEKRADTNIRNKKGNTPLHAALGSILCSSYRSSRYVEAYRLLLQNGATLDVQNNQGLTPLELAEQENTELYKLLK